MFDESKSYQNNFPNIIYKKKLAPLPLFKQNLSPKKSFETPKKRTQFGFNSKSAGLLPQTVKSGGFINEFKTINNYGRLCDQPFLEFSSFHSEQVFGSGGGKKKIRLDPIQLKKDKKKIQKLYTMAVPNNFMASAIKIEDNAYNARTEEEQVPQEAPVKSPEIQSAASKKLQKVYQIGEYEAIISFVSLEITLKSKKDAEAAPVSIFLSKNDLHKVYKLPTNELIQTILESLTLNNQGNIVASLKVETPQSGRYVGDEDYPDDKENLTANINGQQFDVTITFPYLEISIERLNYTEKLGLRPIFLANLYEEKFDNLQDYVQRFNIPPQVYKNKEELHNDELKSLPTIIKKVIKTADFGGLMLFKSLEIHLKNTSEMEPQIMMGESLLTPMAKNLHRKKTRDINTVLLRLNIDQLQTIVNLTSDEICELMRESLVIEEGTGFSVSFDPENLRPYKGRDQPEAENFPEVSGKFNVRFNKFLYEVFIKFPTLELYIPETNFKEVLQLTPAQLQDLLNNSFNNMEDYIDQFKRVISTPREEDEQKEEEKTQEEDQAKEDEQKNEEPETKEEEQRTEETREDEVQKNEVEQVTEQSKEEEQTVEEEQAKEEVEVKEDEQPNEEAQEVEAKEMEQVKEEEEQQPKETEVAPEEQTNEQVKEEEEQTKEEVKEEEQTKEEAKPAPRVTLLVSYTRTEDDPRFETADQVGEISANLGFRFLTIDFSESDEFGPEELENHLQVFEESEYLIFVCQVRSTLEAAKVQTYVHRLQSVNPKLDQVLFQKKIFFILNTENASKDQATVSFEKELNAYYRGVFAPLGPSFLRNVYINSEQSKYFEKIAVLEERLKQLDQAPEEVKDVDASPMSTISMEVEIPRASIEVKTTEEVPNTQTEEAATEN